MKRADLIIISPDFHIDSLMTGIGCRLWEIAVTLATFYGLHLKIFLSKETDLKCHGIQFEIYQKDKIDVIAGSGKLFLVTYGCDPFIVNSLKKRGKKLIFDALTTPIEILDYQKTLELNRMKDRAEVFNVHLARYKELLSTSDYIIVGSFGEKSFMIGELLMLGRITPANYKELPKAIDIIPIGFSTVSKRIYGKKRGNVFVWNGGVWNHYSVDHLLAAFRTLHRRDPSVKIDFLYRSRTNNFKKVEAVASKRNSCVILPDEKLDYFNRAEILSSAKGVIILIDDTLESYTTLRIRLKDVFAHAIPVITSKFGLLGEFIGMSQIGLTVDNKAGSIERAVRTFVEDPMLYKKFKKNIESVRKRFSYRHTLKNFARYINAINKESSLRS